MKRIREDRSLGMFILLTLCTLGIYGLWYYWHLIKDFNVICGTKNPDAWKSPNLIILILLTVVTCGFYGLYWLYKMGNTLQTAGEMYGIKIEENGTTLLLWDILGALVCCLGPFVAWNLLLHNMNKVSKCYNEEFVDGAENYQNEQGGYAGDNRYADNNRYENNGGRANNGGYAGNNNYDNGRQNYASGDVTVGTQYQTIGMLQGGIIATRGSMNGAEITIQDGEVVTVGRDSTVCNLILEERDISRRHCTIQYSASDGCYYVTDYSSLGTRLNGVEPLQKGVMTRCSRGSRLLLGQGSNEIMLK